MLCIDTGILHLIFTTNANNILAEQCFTLGSNSSQDSTGNIPQSDYTPPGSLDSRNSIPRAGSEEFPPPPPDSMSFQHRHSSGILPSVTPPPDLTRQVPSHTDTKGSRVMHMSSVRTIEEDDGQLSGKMHFSIYKFG